MESEVLDASNPYTVGGDYLILDQDPYETDIYEVPDPGLLKEERESSFSERAPQLFTNNSQWQNMAQSARARQLWLLLRTGLQTFVEKEKRAELHVARLTHGLEPLRRLEVAAGLFSVAQDPVGRRFVVLDGAGHLHLHREDGWAQEKLLAPVALTGLVAVLGPLGTVGRFVGWGPVGLAILKSDLSLLWLSKPGEHGVPGHEPICCLPVPDPGLLLVAEAGGSLVLWKFRSGGRCLVPHRSPLQLPPSISGALARLALGPRSPHHDPCCFAAYGSAVLTFDLQTWALTDVRRNLHKTTIFDLAYCKEVEAMVTASRDSTVKVWEADWQIRMVFVGHRGPVTAVTVLPNTALVVSASQDGTLRTWDLQAAAQVGEVALTCWGRGVPSESVSRLLAPAGPGWPLLSLEARSVGLWRARELYSPLAQLSAPVLHLQLAPALPKPTAPHVALPARLVCACADGSVYLVSVSGGRTVSALLLEPEDCAAAVAYCLPREALWVLTRAGHLLCANAARSPMRVLRRLCPPPPPAPQPCCLHLYSHLTDPTSAFTNWEIVCQYKGELCRGDVAWAWKDKNRYLPVVGHTDGTLSVLELRSLKTVFRTEAHSPGPVTAIASTWNSIVSSGGDLTVKMWRVFPYAEESLSPLRTFCCCHPAVVLCALGKRVTVGFEDPNNATYGLVQFGLGSSPRYDHRPQDDPTDRITGLCCCPTLKLYASSSLDCTIRIWTAENKLLRLLHLNGAPQALTFCSNNGDLVLALGSRLCLVDHRFYLPTSYLLKNLCQEVPDGVDDPPLPLTSPESLTAAQLQRLANLRGVASLSTALCFIHRQTTAPQQPVLEEDLEVLVARNQDLQQLRLGLESPAARPQLTWQQRQQAFDNYLHLIYGPGMLVSMGPPGASLCPGPLTCLCVPHASQGLDSEAEPQQQWGTVALAVEKETWDPSAQPRDGPALGGTEAPPLQDVGTLGRRFACPPRVPLPLPPTYRRVHSRASQLLARSSLSCELGLSLDLQLQWDQLSKKPLAWDPPSPNLGQSRTSLLPQRRPQELLSNLSGFFPATIHPYKYWRGPIRFPGCVPNSVVLQQMWLPEEVSGLGALGGLSGSRESKQHRGQEDLWLVRGIRRRHTKQQQKLIQWLRDEEDEDEEEPDLDWSLESPSPPHRLPSDPLLVPVRLRAQSAKDPILSLKGTHEDTAKIETYLHHPQFHYAQLLWEQRYGHLPKFLQFFVEQNWFKKLFPIFTLQAYPKMGTVEGLASAFMDLLEEASWADRVHVLRALLRLLPDLSREFCSRLQGTLLHLLNLEQPPSLQDRVQKQFVMLALQLLLACSLESREVVVELMSYFLYSPAPFRPELRRLLDGLGLQDPQGFLFKEMMTWVQGPDPESKATLRRRCCQKLEEMIQQLQMETMQLSVAKMSEVLPKVSETSGLHPPSKEALLQISMLSGAAGHVSVTSSNVSQTPSLVVSAGVSDLTTLEPQAQQTLPQLHFARTRRALSETLTHFCLQPEVVLRSSAPAILPHEMPPHEMPPHGMLPHEMLPHEMLPLAQMVWSQSKMLDLGPIDALNFFCEQQCIRQQGPLPEEPYSPLPGPPLPPQFCGMVLPHSPDPRHDRILRLQEARVQRCPMRLRGEWGQGWKSDPGPAQFLPSIHPTPQSHHPAGPPGRMLSRLCVDRSLDSTIRILKLPLPRVELQPFPPDWPRSARPLPPRLLHPALQRYFLPDDTNPDNYR
ncbi:WD repeat-containing protein 97 isoform X5 [Bubalus bubalis]|uniref:WD repeat-containing protein 97 isoform X5 n=1 Tax=Bubalus bubalis TaxID=89462 RepID=UPI001D1176CD|nr:WD repeat-containing protein 97 isoform X5 [Bubalus bubalis]